MRTGTRHPIEAELAKTDIGLLDFARKAGKNIFSVIPDATRTQKYLKGPANIHYVCDPEMVTELLAGVGRSFPKSQFTRNVIGPAVGNGMILSEGEKWRAQRHRYAPLFAARNLPVLTSHFAATGDDLAGFFARADGEVDVADAAQEATLTNISRVMFSGNEAVSKRDVRQGMRRFTDYISYMSLFDLMGLPTWLPRVKWLRSTKAITDLRQLTRDVIANRQAQRHAEPQDFLDLLIEALETDREDIETTVDNLLTFVAAGYETSANTVAWGLYLLALHPEAQTTLRAEIAAACSDGPITFETLPNMPLLQAHVRETLRFYPRRCAFCTRRDQRYGNQGGLLQEGRCYHVPRLFVAPQRTALGRCGGLQTGPVHRPQVSARAVHSLWRWPAHLHRCPIRRDGNHGPSGLGGAAGILWPDGSPGCAAKPDLHDAPRRPDDPDIATRTGLIPQGRAPAFPTQSRQRPNSAIWLPQKPPTSLCNGNRAIRRSALSF